MNQVHMDEIIAALREQFRGSGRAWREVRGGLAVSYSDGDDLAFFNRRILVQTPDLPTEPAAAAQMLATQFELEDERRSRVLNGLRHLFAQHDIAVKRTNTGTWELQSRRGDSGELDVGVVLTQLVRTLRPAESLVKLVGMNFLKRSAPVVAELTSVTAPPELELLWDETLEEADSIVGPLGYLITEDPSDSADSAQRAKRRRRKSVDTKSRDLPGDEVVQRLREQLGKDKLHSCPLSSGSRAEFEFSDPFDHFPVVPRGKRLARRIRDEGIDAVVEQLVQHYRRLDFARERFFAAVRQVMAARGYVLDHGLNAIWFGRTYRELQLDPGRSLTLKLKHRPWETVLIEQLCEWKIPDVPAAANLPSIADGPLSIIERDLPFTEPGAAPSLPELDEFDFERVDKLALQAIARLKRDIADQPDKFLYMWTDSTYYRRGIDDWANEAWWVFVAQRMWDNQPWLTPAAILIANGVEGTREKLQAEIPEFVAAAHDFSESRLLWILLDDPWTLADEDGELPGWFFQLGSPPPEIAWKSAAEVRAQLAGRGQPTEDEPNPDDSIISTMLGLDAVAAREWLTRDEIEAVHDACRRWAGCDDVDRFSDSEPEQLVVAMRQGWNDILELLDRNPAFLEKLLVGTCTDMPPFLGYWAGRLSAAGRSELSARLAAKTLTLNVDEDAAARTKLLMDSFRAANAACPSPLFRIPMNESEMLTQQKEGVLADQYYAAIAWHRWRQNTAAEF